MKRISLFYKIYFSAVAVFAVALAVGLAVFGGWLKKYEARQPNRIAESFVEDYVKTGEIYSVREEYNILLSSYETEDGFKEALNKLLSSGEVQIGTAVKKDGCDAAYYVKTGETKLLNIYMKKGGSKNRFSVSSLEFEASLYKGITIKASSDSEIKVNGIKVADGDRQNEKLPDIKSELLINKAIVNKQTITLDGFLKEPESVTAERDGAELEVETEGNSYTVKEEFAEKEDISDIAGKAASEYAAYMQNDSNLTRVRKYMDTDTDFYKNIRTSLVIFALDHDSYTIKDLTVTDCHKYSNGLFSCRVRLSNVLKLGKNEYVDRFDKYVYLRRDGNTFKVIDMQNTAEEQK